jgi:cell division protein FtsB
MNIIFKIVKYLKSHKEQIKKALPTIFICIVVTFIAMDIIIINNINKNKEINAFEQKVENLQNENKKLLDATESMSAIIEDRDNKISSLSKEVDILKKDNESFEEQVEILHTQINKEHNPDYAQAVTVWNYLKAIGLNDYVAAGIIGNIMAEVGGHTLNFSRYSTIDTANYFGMCQWAGGRKARLLRDFGTTIEDQCRFLGVELYEEIPKGSSFYTLQDEREAALYFAKYYERCNSNYYSVRQDNATKAYQYFVGN